MNEENQQHLSERLLACYVSGNGGLAGDDDWAVEAHLESCAECRGRLAALSAPSVTTLVDSVWTALGPRLDELGPHPPLRRRWTARTHTWMTPVILPWLVAILLLPALGFLLDEAAFTSVDGLSFVRLLAPVLPVLGVAAAWSRGLDPAYELVVSAPRGGFYLVLRRTTAVLAVVLPVQAVAGWLSGSGFGLGLGLLPSLAFTTGTLALGALIGVPRAAIVLAGIWLAVIMLPAVASEGRLSVLEPELLPVWGGIFVLTAAVVVLRRSAFGRLSGFER